jgi:hypothetical protein
MAELITTHVIEVSVGIIFVNKLLSLGDNQLSAWSQSNLNSNAREALAFIVIF